MPHAELIPQYRSKHRRFGGVLLGSLILVVPVILCWFSGAHLLPFLSTFGLIVVAATRSSLSAGLLSRSVQPSQLNALIRRLCVVALFACVFWLFRHPMALEEFLMGRSPWIVIALSIAAILVGLDANRRISGLCRKRYEAGVPLALSIHDLQRPR